MRAYDVAFSPDPRWERWQYGQRVKGLPVKMSNLSPNYLRVDSLSTIETRPHKCPRTPPDGEADPGVSEITNRRCELAGSAKTLNQGQHMKRR
jgi:hypothetical protein